MQCPRCSGELPPQAMYCGVCGHGMERTDNSASPSLFQLPVSKGAKFIRLGLILLFDVALVVGGFVLIMAYLGQRATFRATAQIAVDIQTGAGSDGGGDTPASKTDRVPEQRIHAKTVGGKEVVEHRPRKPPVKNGPGRRIPSAPSPKPDPGNPVDDALPSTPVRTSAETTTAKADTPVDAGTIVDAGTMLADANEEQQAAQVQLVASKISVVVSRHQGQLRHCYQSSSKVSTPDQPLEGTIEVQFSVQMDGSAKEVKVVSNSTGSATLGKCLSSLVAGWTFPSSGGEPLDFVWPFEFQAPD